MRNLALAQLARVLAVFGALSAHVARAADPPSAYTRAIQATAASSRRFADRQDFDFATRGFVATRSDSVIRNAAGQPVWDLSAFDFLKGAPPATVNPSLWRQGQLLAISGLFRVSDRVWQVRGFDVSNMTVVRGDTGWIIIDTLYNTETARAAFDLVQQKLGQRPIVAIIYSHSHVDHYGGAGGLVSAADAASGKVQVIAPKGFLAAAVGENVIAGPAMQRRAAYQFGGPLPKGPLGLVNEGIGLGTPAGTPSLIPPNREIDRDGEMLTIDGVRLAFQLTPGTEAPSEMNIDMPDWRVVYLAENANASQHNVLTPRGAVVRDAKAWADDLTEALARYGDSGVLVGGHAWPRFGKAAIDDYVSKQRDYYAFVHDQTVRLMNQGLDGDEIAARLKLPERLDQTWFDQPFYGSLSFNSRAVYQYYMGWYDANPVHLAPLPPAQAGRRYVAALGGPERVLSLAQAAYDQGDYSWAAELLNRAVMADSHDAAARALLARCYDQLGWQSENAPWRNIYLTGASELRDGIARRPEAARAQSKALDALSTAQVFDLLAVRLDADKVGTASLKLQFVFPERREQVYLTVENGVLIHQPIAAPGPLDATITADRADVVASLLAGAPLAPKLAAGQVHIVGDPNALARLTSWLDRPDPSFPIVSRHSVAN